MRAAKSVIHRDLMQMENRRRGRGCAWELYSFVWDRTKTENLPAKNATARFAHKSSGPSNSGAGVVDVEYRNDAGM